jgi:hypothetical protein
MGSLFRFAPVFLLLLAVITAMGYLFLLPQSEQGSAAPKPQYDLIFGVYTFDPNRQARVWMGPYIIDGTLYLEAEKLPAEQGTNSTWITLYRYHSQTGIAEPLPSPTFDEWQNIDGKQTFVLPALHEVKLNTNKQSPDGYSLVEPKWVKVDPISNVLGNIALFLFSGGFETITKRESTPRLAKGELSVPIKSKRPIFNNEADNAFFLGWVIPASQ